VRTTIMCIRANAIAVVLAAASLMGCRASSPKLAPDPFANPRYTVVPPPGGPRHTAPGFSTPSGQLPPEQPQSWPNSGGNIGTDGSPNDNWPYGPLHQQYQHNQPEATPELPPLLEFETPQSRLDAPADSRTAAVEDARQGSSRADWPEDVPAAAAGFSPSGTYGRPGQSHPDEVLLPFETPEQIARSLASLQDGPDEAAVPNGRTYALPPDRPVHGQPTANYAQPNMMAAADASDSAAGTASIQGRVVDGTGSPRANALVIIVPAEADGLGSRIDLCTGPRGYFRADKLEPGRRYLVLATVLTPAGPLIGRATVWPPADDFEIRVMPPTASANRLQVPGRTAEPCAGIIAAGTPSSTVSARPADSEVAAVRGRASEQLPWSHLPLPPRQTAADGPRHQPQRAVRMASAVTESPWKPLRPSSTQYASRNPPTRLGLPIAGAGVGQLARRVTRPYQEASASARNNVPTQPSAPLATQPPARTTGSYEPRRTATSAGTGHVRPQMHNYNYPAYRRPAATLGAPQPIIEEQYGVKTKGSAGLTTRQYAAPSGTLPPPPSPPAQPALPQSQNASPSPYPPAAPQPQLPPQPVTRSGTKAPANPPTLRLTPQPQAKANPPATQRPATRSPLPPLVLSDIDGRNIALQQLDCSLVLLDFWATWCQPCVRAMPHLQELHRRYARYGLKVLGVTDPSGNPTETAARARMLRDRLGLNYTLLLDRHQSEPLRNRFGIQLYPTMVLLDRHGNLLWRCEGLDQRQLEQLERLLQQHLLPSQAAAIENRW